VSSTTHKRRIRTPATSFLYGAVAGAVILIALIPPHIASADTIAISNPEIDHKTYYNTSSAQKVAYQTIGSGWTTTVTGIAAHFEGIGSGFGIYVQYRILCYTDSAYSIGCTNSASTTRTFYASGLGSNYYAQQTLTPYTLLAANYSKIAFGLEGHGSAPTPAIIGNAFNLTTIFPTGAATGTMQGCDPADCPSSLAFDLYTNITDNAFPAVPAGGEIYAQNPISLTGQYFNCNTHTYDSLRYFFSLTGSSTTYTYTYPISSCGSVAYSRTQAMPEAGTYTYKAQLYDLSSAGLYSTSLSASTTFTLQSFLLAEATTSDVGLLNFSNITFNTPTSSGIFGTSSSLTVTCDPNSGFFANSFCNLFQYLFQPDSKYYATILANKDLIVTKPPFGYLSAFETAFNADATTTGGQAAIGSYLAYFSGTLGFLRTGLASILWVLLGLWIFHRVRKWEFQV